MPKAKFKTCDQCESAASCPLLGCAFPLIGTYKKATKIGALIFRALKGWSLGNGDVVKVEKLLRLVAKKAFEAGRSNHMDDDGLTIPEYRFENRNFKTYWKENYGKTPKQIRNATHKRP